MKFNITGKKIAIVLAIILVNNSILMVMNFLFTQLNDRIKTSQMEVVCMDIKSHIDVDDDFESVYGEVIDVVLDKDHKTADLGNRTILIPCIVKTEGEKQYLVWFKYHEYSTPQPVDVSELIES